MSKLMKMNDDDLLIAWEAYLDADDETRLRFLHQIRLIKEDADAFRWLLEDHSSEETRIRCRELWERLPVMSLSAAREAIYAARHEAAIRAVSEAAQTAIAENTHGR